MKNFSYLMSLGHMCSDIPQGALSAILPTLIATYNLDYTTAATLMMVYSVSNSLVQPGFGILADKWNQPWLIILALALADGAMCAIGWMSTFWALVIIVMLSGVGVAMFHPQAALTVNKLSTNENRGKNLSIFSFGGQMGFALGPIIVTAALYYVGVRGTIVIVLPAILICTLIFHYLGELKAIGVRDAQKKKSKAKAIVNNWSGFARLSFCILGRSVINASMNTFLALYCMHVLGQTKTTSTSILSFFFILSAAATLLGGNLADKYGYRRISKISFAMMFPALVLLSWTKNLYLGLLVLLPIAIAISLSYSPIVVLGQLYLPKNAGLASGVTMGLAVSIGGVFAPFMGKIADVYGLNYTFYAIAAVSVIPLVMSFLLPDVEGDEKST